MHLDYNYIYMYNVFLFILFFNFSMISCEHSTVHEIKISAIDHFIEFLHKYMQCTYYILNEACQRQE